jgi:hypothetical protein
VYIDRLAQLLDSSGGKIDSMDAKMQGVIQQFRWTAEFFCEDVNVGWKQQPAAFITHFAGSVFTVIELGLAELGFSSTAEHHVT